MKSESGEQFRACFRTTGHFSLLSCIGSTVQAISTCNQTPDIKQCTCWQSHGEFNRGNDLIDTNNNNNFTLQILKIKRFFLLAIRGLLAALGNTRFCVLKHVFITSQSRKDYSNVKPLLFQGKGVPSAFPRCHGSAQDLWALSYTSCRRSSSLPPSAGAVFWLASQGYLGRSNKQDLIDVV